MEYPGEQLRKQWRSERECLILRFEWEIFKYIFEYPIICPIPDILICLILHFEWESPNRYLNIRLFASYYFPNEKSSNRYLNIRLFAWYYVSNEKSSNRYLNIRLFVPFCCGTNEVGKRGLIDIFPPEQILFRFYMFIPFSSFVAKKWKIGNFWWG